MVDGSYSGSNGGGGPPGPNGGSVELHRGPLTFALRPNSTVDETVIGCIGGKPAGRWGWNCTSTPGGKPQFPDIKSRNVAVSTLSGSGGNWSFGILPDTAQYFANGTLSNNVPFDVNIAPVVYIKVKARNLNYASLGDNSVAKIWENAGVPPASPLRSDAPLEDIILVPFGATNIRISVFPELEE